MSPGRMSPGEAHSSPSSATNSSRAPVLTPPRAQPSFWGIFPIHLTNAHVHLLEGPSAVKIRISYHTVSWKETLPSQQGPAPAPNTAGQASRLACGPQPGKGKSMFFFLHREHRAGDSTQLRAWAVCSDRALPAAWGPETDRASGMGAAFEKFLLKQAFTFQSSV